jgi:C1A family cysteine protease
MISSLLALLGVFSTAEKHTHSRYPSFDAWCAYFNRSYTVGSERDYRNSVYDANVKFIKAHNRGGHNWTMAVNKFADLTANEFAWHYISNGFHVDRRGGVNVEVKHLRYELKALPPSVDWTKKGAVSPVKDQGQCGSCWAFSTTGSVESAWFLKNGTLVSLSEQQLVDCSVSQGNMGCNGGLMDYGFQYIIDNKGLTAESEYPYTATGPNKCLATGDPVYARISTYKDVPANSEVALLSAIAQQPVSVAVEADQNAFQFYSSGVMTAKCGTNLDHGVLAVGYGTVGGQDYYLVKNSWGADWGEKGFIMLGRGPKFGAAGQCGVQMAASYPVV